MNAGRTDALRQRILQRLGGTAPHTQAGGLRLAGLLPEYVDRFPHIVPSAPQPAAVLIPIIDHGDCLTILFTQRAADLRHHGGQISFPGGRVEAGDESPLQTALREAQEEIGLSRDHLEIIGYLPDHLVISGFRVTPVVALVRPGFQLKLDATEVTDTFEAPLEYLLDAANHKSRRRLVGADQFEVYDIPWNGRHIWGATAGMLMTLHHLLLTPLPSGEGQG